MAAIVLSAGFVMAQKDESTALNRAVIKIDTLSCGACFSTINAGLKTLDGFSGMGANLFRKLIAVDFSEPLTQEAISKKLIEVGYPGQIENVNPIMEKESFAAIESKRNRFSGYGGGGCGGCPGAGVAAQGRPVLPSRGSCCAVPGSAALPQGEAL